jgi:hypothetical protein
MVSTLPDLLKLASPWTTLSPVGNAQAGGMANVKIRKATIGILVAAGKPKTLVERKKSAFFIAVIKMLSRPPEQ